MGDEADADWQDGLVEWGIEDTRERYREILEKAARTSPFRFRKKRQRRTPHSEQQRETGERNV
jgi:hypothetical protein